MSEVATIQRGEFSDRIRGREREYIERYERGSKMGLEEERELRREGRDESESGRI